MVFNVYKRMSYKFANIFVFVMVLLFLQPNANAVSSSHEKSSDLDIGGLIIDHVVNSYEWHIITVKGKHYSIPLPIIIIDRGGVHIFSSERFHHAQQSYMGYAICQERGLKKGRIIKVDESGKAVSASFIDVSMTKNVVSLLFSIVLITILFISVAKGYKKRGVSSPKGIARIIEPVI